MKHSDHSSGPSRRTILKAGATTAALACAGLEVRADEEAGTESTPLPTRVLGKTGQAVSMLNLGTARNPGDRMLNATYDAGIRYLDTADCYANGNSETEIAEWLQKNGKRKEFFIVTKDHPSEPREWVEMVDNRLAALKIDQIDMFFIHGLGEGFMGGGETKHRLWPKSKEWGQAAEEMKKSGKVRFVGFSTHTNMKLRTELLNNAAQGGWVDAIMVATDPKTMRDETEFNKSLDACHQAGIGLISMKEMRGVGTISQTLPEFEQMGITPHQGILHAMWSDQRFASICSDMPNTRILKENSDAARNFKPLTEKQVSAVIGLYGEYAGGYCNGCDGRCAKAAGTGAALGDIARYLSYCERDGLHKDARTLFAGLTPEQRNWAGADLAAASEACVSKLDFESILKRAEQRLA